MINYHVRKSKKSRITYRITGIAIALVSITMIAMQLFLLIRNGSFNHRIGTFIAIIFGIYGVYLFLASFRTGAYDTDYEFKEEDFIVHGRWRDETFSYKDITDLSHIIPENEAFYSLIHISIGKKSFILPFSYKEEVASRIYNLLKEKTGLELDLRDDSLRKASETAGQEDEDILTPQLKRKIEEYKNSTSDRE